MSRWWGLRAAITARMRASVTIATFCLGLCLAVGSPAPSRSLLAAAPEDGCYLDRPCDTPNATLAERDLTYVNGFFDTTPQMTRYKCSVMAAARNFTYAAVQEGYMCFGGSSVRELERSPDKWCDTKCTGDSSEICGSYCVNSVFRISATIQVANSLWTNNETGADHTGLDTAPQICPPGQYIARWALGFVAWDEDNDNRLTWVQGFCSTAGSDEEVELQPAQGQYGTESSDTSKQSPPQLESPSGFTCGMLQQGSLTDDFLGSAPEDLSVAVFLGQGDVAVKANGFPWSICARAVPPDWVAIGYERVAGSTIRALRFIFASPEMANVTRAHASSPSPSLQPAGPALPTADAAEGCYVDRPCFDTPVPGLNKRDIQYIAVEDTTKEAAMTHYKCAVLAAALGYQYAGLQAGHQCYAANDTAGLKRASDEGFCDVKCTGNAKEVCGAECYFSVYRIADGITAQYTARSDFKSEYREPSLKDSPQVCPKDQYITRWVVGLGTWQYAGEPSRLLSIQGICSGGFELLPARGKTAPQRFAANSTALASATGFTCSMLQQGGATDADPLYPVVVTAAGFLGQGEVAANRKKVGWTICTSDMPTDWVAIGYETIAGDVINSIRFLLGPRNMSSAANAAPGSGSRQAGAPLNNATSPMQTPPKSSNAQGLKAAGGLYRIADVAAMLIIAVMAMFLNYDLV